MYLRGSYIRALPHSAMANIPRRNNTHLASPQMCVLRAHRPCSLHCETFLLATNGGPSAGPSCSQGHHKFLTKAVHLPSCQNAPNQLQLGPIQMPSCNFPWKGPARNPSKPAWDNETMAWMNVSKPLAMSLFVAGDPSATMLLIQGAMVKQVDSGRSHKHRATCGQRASTLPRQSWKGKEKQETANMNKADLWFDSGCLV